MHVLLLQIADILISLQHPIICMQLPVFFTLQDGSTLVDVTVRNSSLVRNIFLGRVRVPLNEIAEAAEGGLSREFTLFNEVLKYVYQCWCCVIERRVIMDEGGMSALFLLRGVPIVNHTCSSNEHHYYIKPKPH